MDNCENFTYGTIHNICNKDICYRMFFHIFHELNAFGVFWAKIIN